MRERRKGRRREIENNTPSASKALHTHTHGKKALSRTIIYIGDKSEAKKSHDEPREQKVS